MKKVRGKVNLADGMPVPAAKTAADTVTYHNS